MDTDKVIGRARSVIEKYNKNHDRLGRFASASGGGGADAATWQQNGRTYMDSGEDVYGSSAFGRGDLHVEAGDYSDVETTGSTFQATRPVNYDLYDENPQSGRQANRIWNAFPSLAHLHMSDSLTEEERKYVADALVTMAKRYPEAAKTVKVIRVPDDFTWPGKGSSTATGTQAYASMGYVRYHDGTTQVGAMMEFGVRAIKNAVAREKSGLRQVADPDKFLGDETVHGLVSHEFGHVASYNFAFNNVSAGSRGRGPIDIEDARDVVHGKILNQYSSPVNRPRYKVSGYSQHNQAEWFAETFSAMNSRNPEIRALVKPAVATAVRKVAKTKLSEHAVQWTGSAGMDADTVSKAKKLKRGMKGYVHSFVGVQICDGINMKEKPVTPGQATLEKAHVVLSKYNKNHDRRGRFASSPGGAGGRTSGRTNSMDGLDEMVAPKPKKLTIAQKKAEIDSLTPAQMKRYERAPEHMGHSEAMAYARAGNNAGRPKSPKTVASTTANVKDADGDMPPIGKTGKPLTPPAGLLWPDPGPKKGDPVRGLEGMRPATKYERKYGVVDADGNRYRIPPPYRDVYVAVSAKGNPRGLMWAGIATKADGSPKAQPGYTLKHHAAASDTKFKRVAGASTKIAKVDKNASRDIAKGDQRAVVTSLVLRTGMRIGSTAKGTTDKESFGASTLLSKHVKVNGDKITIDYIGKSQKPQHYVVRDAKLAAAITKLKTGKSANAPIFDQHVAGGDKSRAYMRSIGGSGLKMHDLRTYNATRLAIHLVTTMPVPKSLSQLKAQRKAVGEIVGKEVLGDTATTALKHYIHSAVFAEWEKGVVA